MTREDWRRQVSRDEDVLSLLFDIYFNEDWPDLYGRPWTNVLDAFVAKRGSGRVQATLEELEQLLSDDLSDADLRWLLDDVVRIAFNWESPGLGFTSARQWLEALRDELKRRAPQEV